MHSAALRLHPFLSWATSFFFFFNDTATTEIYTLSLHDALPISVTVTDCRCGAYPIRVARTSTLPAGTDASVRSEEHTSELQSRPHLVCRLLLEKKKSNSEKLLPRPD